jgi:tungstate transport system ATP-binding protein
MSSILPLKVENLAFFRAGQTLLDDVSFRLEAGTRTLILGPNGAGKSLLLRLCHGLIQPSSGRILWQGADAARKQAMVFQRPVLLRRTALANIDYALKVRGLARQQAEGALERAGLGGLAHRQARVLSGGEQQRLALARAWALEPEVLFLDEPTASLDPGATRAVEALIGAIARTGTKIIMTTHDLGQARRLADEILFLDKGRLIEHGPAADFFAQPKSAEAQAFLKGDLPW